MDPNISRDAGVREERPVKSYGHTTIGNGARAHLGDVSQDLNILGGVHIHMHDHLWNVVSVTDEMIQLLHFYTNVLRLGLRLRHDNKYVQWSDVVNLRDFLLNLPSMQARLRIAQVWVQNSANSLIVGEDLHGLIVSFAKDARGLHDVLCQLDRELDDESVAASSLSSPNSVFQELWREAQITEKLKLLLSYREMLNVRLIGVFSKASEKGGVTPTSDSARARINTGQMLNSSDDVVEVLSLSRSLRSGSQNVATILTRENGESVTIAAPQHREDVSPAVRGDNLIRYDLQAKSGRVNNPKDPPPALVKVATDFTTQIKDILYFREESDRRIELRDAHVKTFQWVLQESPDVPASNFRIWLRDGGQCFWINGKAGSGKSTLMKYLHNHQTLLEFLRPWAGSRQLIVGSFFFWQAGSALQKSCEGMLRSLLHQVLEKRPNLVPLLFPRLTRYLLCRQDTRQIDIPERELQTAILLLVQNIPENLAIFLIVDGVDEYNGDHFEFSKFLVRLAQFPYVKILVSSRPIPECHQVFGRFPSLRLQDLTAGDIRAYIEEELVQDNLFQDMDALEIGFGQEVKDALTQKASGVFLWVVLVVKSLLLGLGKYEEREDLISIIDRLPRDLADLYDHMFGKMSREHQRDGSLLLQLTCRAREVQECPFTAIQLFIAERSIKGVSTLFEDSSCRTEVEALRLKAVDGKLRSRCCGLLEVQYSSVNTSLEEPKVDFLHRTVYDYLREPSVRNRLSALHELTPTQLDLALLASCTYMMRRRLFRHDLGTGGVSPHLFSACLAYSIELSSLQEVRYVEHLEAANEAFSSLWENHSWRRDCPYHVASLLLITHDRMDVPKDADLLDFVESLKLTSILCIAGFGLSEYVGRRMKKDVDHEGAAVTLLGRLLALCRSTPFDSRFAQHYLLNLRRLVEYTASCIAQVDLSEDFKDEAYLDPRMSRAVREIVNVTPDDISQLVQRSQGESYMDGPMGEPGA